MQPTDLWATSECRTHRPASKAPLPCARPVPPNVSLRLAAPTERLPGGRQRHPTTSLRGPRPSTDASAAPLPATSPAAPPPAAPSPSAATATPGRVGRATRACGCSCASSSAAIRPGSSVGALCELRAPCAPPKPSSLSGPLPKPPGSCSPPRPRARSWSLAPRSAGTAESVTTFSENPRSAEKAPLKMGGHAFSRTRDHLVTAPKRSLCQKCHVSAWGIPDFPNFRRWTRVPNPHLGMVMVLEGVTEEEVGMPVLRLRGPADDAR